MTIDEAKQKLVAWCNSQVGYREGANNWNQYAEKLDRIDNLTWGPKQNQPWCGEFVLCAFVECFGVDTALELQCSSRPTSIPLCSAGAGYFKQAGRWFTNPQVGDVVFFLVNGAINHTGIVTSVGMGAITTVEGNSGDMVARNTVPLNSPRLAGFGRPRWDLVQSNTPPAQDDQPEEPETPADEKKPFALAYSAEGWAVQSCQGMLIAHGYSCGPDGADGELGYNTMNAVRRFQRDLALPDTGAIDAVTLSALIGVDFEHVGRKSQWET